MGFGKSNQNSFMENGKELYKQKCFQTFKYLSFYYSLIGKLYYFLCTFKLHWTLYQFSSVAQSCLTLCDPTDCSTSGLPALHQLPELTQIHVRGVGDAIEPFHPVISFSSCLQSFPASGSFPVSQLFSSGGQIIGASASASVLPTNIQDWFPLGWTGWISLQSKGLSKVFSNTTVRKHQFFGAQLSSQSNSHIHTWQLEKP